MRTQLVMGVLGMAGIASLAACGTSPSAPASPAPSSASASASASAPSPASSSTAPLAAASSPAPAGTGDCESQVADWYAQTGQTTTAGFQGTADEIAQTLQNGQDATAETFGPLLRQYQASAVPIPACGDPARAWAPMVAGFGQAGTDLVNHNVAAAKKPLSAASASLKIIYTEMARYIPGLGTQ